MYTKKDYEKAKDIITALRNTMHADAYCLGFHLMPPSGWLNDPNGLCHFHGMHHIYFQFTPFKPTWGIKSWGHYTTLDWITYQEEDPFLFADCAYDQDGVYSGSAYVEKDQIRYFYTGNVKHVDGTYDYINKGREQNTLQVISKDGITHGEKRLLLDHGDYPDDMTLHVRDPKIYKKERRYYMVLGARTKQDTGCVLLYVSDDLETWTYHMRIETNTPFGYMWECPDLFDLDGKTFLICCPQGVSRDGFDFANVYQCGYFEIQLDLQAKSYQLSKFVQLDRGFDIYAPQSYVDEQGRRIMIAWMGIPDANYHNEATVAYGWQHALTLPRQLCVENDRLVQKPLTDLQGLRNDAKCMNVKHSTYVDVAKMYECYIQFSTCEEIVIVLRDDIILQFQQNVLSLSMGKSGCGRDIRSVSIPELHTLHIFMDTSSVEIFVNHGVEVFTSRYYTKRATPLHIQGKYKANMQYYTLKPFAILMRNSKG